MGKAIWKSCALCSRTIDTKQDPEAWDADIGDWFCKACRTCEHGKDLRKCYVCQTQGH